MGLDKPVNPSERHGGIDDVDEVTVRDAGARRWEMRTDVYRRGKVYLPTVDATSSYC